MHLNMAGEWIAAGYEVDVVLMRREGALLDLVPEGARVVTLGADRYRNALRPLVDYLHREKPAVLLAAMWPFTVIAVLAARLSRVRVRTIVSDHSILSESYRNRGWLHRVMLRASIAASYRFADERIGVSKGVVADLARLSGIVRDRFRVIYNPAAVGTTSHEHEELPTELAGITGPLILTVGTLKAVKDHASLIDAFARFPSDLGVTLCILGEGGLRLDLEQLVSDKGLTGRVLLPGYRADTKHWYRRADLFVLSSHHEGFGNVIVEALEEGVPVVSTDCPGGPREILCDGKYGCLVPVGDAGALAVAMLAALQETPDSESLKARARDFSVGKIADEYLPVMFPAHRRIRISP